MTMKKTVAPTEVPLSVTAVIIARNEAEMIANCIETLRWCDQILVIDNGSTDQTASLAENLGAKVITHKSHDFADIRNYALRFVKTAWVLYVDADERISPTLYRELAVNIETNEAEVLQIRRINICYGVPFEHGAWENDIVIRAFKKDALKEWSGVIHESPVYEGRTKLLHTPLLHLTHRNTQDNLHKSAEWTIKEAELLAASDIPPVTFKTLIRKGAMEFIRRAYFQGGRKLGMVGLVEALIQGMNRIFVYIQVWELQQTPTVKEKYDQIETDIANQWKHLK